MAYNPILLPQLPQYNINNQQNQAQVHNNTIPFNPFMIPNNTNIHNSYLPLQNNNNNTINNNHSNLYNSTATAAASTATITQSMASIAIPSTTLIHRLPSPISSTITATAALTIKQKRPRPYQSFEPYQSNNNNSNSNNNNNNSSSSNNKNYYYNNNSSALFDSSDSDATAGDNDIPLTTARTRLKHSHSATAASYSYIDQFNSNTTAYQLLPVTDSIIDNDTDCTIEPEPMSRLVSYSSIESDSNNINNNIHHSNNNNNNINNNSDSIIPLLNSSQLNSNPFYSSGALCFCFQFIDIRSLCRCRLVCRQWYIDSNNPLSWSNQSLIIDPWINHVTDQLIHKLNRIALKYLKGIDCSWCQGLTDQCCITLSQLQSLRSIDFGCCDNIAGIEFSRLSVLKYLTKLDLRGCHSINDSSLIELSTVKQLTSLNISYCSEITDIGLKSISESLLLLIELNLRNCSRLSDFGLNYLLTLTGLQSIDLASNKLTDNGCSYLSKILSLQSIDLSEIDLITDSGLLELTNCINLNFLNICLCHRINESALFQFQGRRPRCLINYTKSNNKLTVLLGSNSIPIRALDAEDSDSDSDPAQQPQSTAVE